MLYLLLEREVGVCLFSFLRGIEVILFILSRMAGTQYRLLTPHMPIFSVGAFAPGKDKHPDLITYCLCHLGQVASVSPSEKMGMGEEERHSEE